VSTVLVTGGSGFIGSHAILQLLAAGHQVRTTVRDLKRESAVREMLNVGGAEPQAKQLTFFAASLEKDEGWKEAVAGSEYVLHIASPFPSKIPDNPDDLIVPARDGALRVLRAARDAGVKRVVLTSSFAAIGYGKDKQAAPFTENDWTDPNAPGVLPYTKSKTIAERAAWDFIDKEGGALELAVVNPVGVFGPVLGPDFATSVWIIQRLMDGDMPGLPKIQFGVVDVRDVADLHLRAMTHPAAKHQRFLAVSGDFLTFKQIAEILKAKLGDQAKKVPTREIPDFVVKLVALWDSGARQILPELGHTKNATAEKARTMLNWTPRSREDAIAASGESLVKLGLVKVRGQDGKQTAVTPAA
jgi:nucleoside-diphosphate-sugar epimerase